MNSSSLLYNSIRFVLLLMVQVILFNSINFLGYINPYPYVLFIILFPVNGNRYALLSTSILLGLIMDLFCNSGGVHSAACITLAYLRPSIFKFSFGLSYEYQTVKLNDVLTPERFSFILIAVTVHHLCMFFMEIFALDYFWSILFRTLVSTLFTILMCILIIYLIKPSKR